MNLSGFDLNLLLVLHALLTEPSATAAAKRLHVTQSAVSNALRRLREALGDPLFVRSGRGLTPTPRALELLPALDAAIGHLRGVVEGSAAFDPRTTTRRFTIASTDSEATVLIPRLMPRLAREMPRASVRLVSLDVAFGGPGLAGGEVDVVAGLAVAAPEDCHRRTLYRDALALIARRGHPEIDGEITLAHLSRVPWIDTLVLMGRRGVGGEMAQKTFAHHAVTRTIALAVPSFMMAALAVAHSDCIAGMPRRLAEALAPGLPIVVLDPPFASPPMEIALVWHPRTDADPGHRCFRDLLAAAAADAPPKDTAPERRARAGAPALRPQPRRAAAAAGAGPTRAHRASPHTPPQRPRRS